jgi:dCMP deaminase
MDLFLVLFVQFMTVSHIKKCIYMRKIFLERKIPYSVLIAILNSLFQIFIMESMMNENWDNRWMSLCDHIAQWSKDRSSQFGCVIVDERQSVLSLGWNGFPRGINDEIEERHERPAKYLWTEHSERNAIYNAASSGVVLLGATLYVNGIPCADCARAIIQSGIHRVVMRDLKLPNYVESQKVTFQLFDEVNMDYIIME